MPRKAKPAAASVTVSQSLVDKYAPKSLDEVRGQVDAIAQLKSFEAAPHAKAFVFAGETGTGKTTCARLVALGLGVIVDEAEMGGFWQIASGEQTGETVRERMRSVASRPFFGSGWRVLVVNECDVMTPNAAMVWLDALETLPPMTVVIFTTNHASKLPPRFRDRCEMVYFESQAMFLLRDARDLIQHIWNVEGCTDKAPSPDDLGAVDQNGNISFRRILQLCEPHVRRRCFKARPIPPAPPIAPVMSCARQEGTFNTTTLSIQEVRSNAARKAWATRNARRAGV